MANYIMIQGLKPSKSVIRSIERQVEKWIETEGRPLSPHTDHAGNYTVRVEAEEWRHFVHCSLQVKIGSNEWHSEESAKSLHDVLSRAIRHLKPTQATDAFSRPAPETPAAQPESPALPAQKMAS
jgi:hypothetical protein